MHPLFNALRSNQTVPKGLLSGTTVGWASPSAPAGANPREVCPTLGRMRRGRHLTTNQMPNRRYA